MPKNKNDISVLLQKFYKGECTIEEEEVLKKHFSIHAKSEFDTDSHLFGYLSHEVVPHFDDELEVTKALDKIKKKRFEKIFKLATNWAAAAAIVIAIGFGWLSLKTTEQIGLTDTFDNPHEALIETKRVLALVGSKLNRVQDDLQPLKKLHTPTLVTEPIGNLTKNLEYLNLIQIIDKPKSIPVIKHIFEDDFDSDNGEENK